jgi:hypothetical protein
MHPSTFETAADDIVRAASETGPDLAYFLSSGLDSARLHFGSADALTDQDHTRIAEALPIIEGRFVRLAEGFIPAHLLHRCFDALEALVRLWAEPPTVRSIAEPAALSEAVALVRILQNTAHNVVLRASASAASERRGRGMRTPVLGAGPQRPEGL